MGSPRVEVVPACLEHAIALARRMREADRLECQAARGMSPLAALIEALAVSEFAATALFDGEVACMWGVQPIRVSVVRGRVGAAWLLTSDLVEKHPRAFWRHCRAELGRLFDYYDTLLNAVDVRHAQAIRWGTRLGFQFDEPTVYGREDRPFRWFHVTREDLCAHR